MYPEERQEAIVERISRQGRAAVVELAVEFDVTAETVRRDLDRLEQQGFVRRVHGGAVSATNLTVLETGVAQREQEQAEQKDRIADAAVDLLPGKDASILIDAGTTTGRLAARLPAHSGLTVVTNALPIAHRIAIRADTTLELVGGHVRGTTHAAVGDRTNATLGSLRVDVAFLGTNGLTAGFGASTPDMAEAAAKRGMVAAGHQVVVLADATKLGREQLHAFANIEQIDVVITDRDADPQQVARLEAAGVKVVLA